MRLDVPTLLLVTMAVTAMSAALLLLAWLQNRRTTALAWWCGANALAAVAVPLIAARSAIPDILSIDLANALLFAGYGMFWSGFRLFEGRPVRPVWAALGSFAWLAACQVPEFHASPAMRVILASVVTGAYVSAAALDVWRGRAERLLSRYPAIVLLGLHAALYFVRVPLAVLFPPPARVFDSPWYAALCFESVLHVVAMAFIMVAMAKERVELEHRVAAATDALTGVANRRALLKAGEAHLRRAARTGTPVALLLFDLDRFKALNDSHGHQAGDRFLLAFCDAASKHLPATTDFGRLGGEEFACFLPGMAGYAATRLAERVRAAFAAAALDVGGRSVRATVSVGVAAARNGAGLDALLADADRALYEAKAQGRDRVVLADAARDRAERPVNRARRAVASVA